jgi:hypothetical protein
MKGLEMEGVEVELMEGLEVEGVEVDSPVPHAGVGQLQS